MIHKKYTRFVFAFFMSLLMSGIMSFAISVVNLGLVDNIFIIWLKSWSIAFAIAFPTIVVVAPVVHKLVDIFIAGDDGPDDSGDM